MRGTVNGHTHRAGPGWTASPPRQVDHPRPLDFPRDDGPHAALIEWWYYTGDLFSVSGERFGFEFVVFKGEWRGIVGLVSHVAVTDNARGIFRFGERFILGDGRSSWPGTGGFDLQVGDWSMRGADGRDQLSGRRQRQPDGSEARGLRGGGDRAMDGPAGDRSPLPLRLDRPGAGDAVDRVADPGPPGSGTRHRGDHRDDLLGGSSGGLGDAGRSPDPWTRLRRVDRVRLPTRSDPIRLDRRVPVARPRLDLRGVAATMEIPGSAE